MLEPRTVLLYNVDMPFRGEVIFEGEHVVLAYQAGTSAHEGRAYGGTVYYPARVTLWSRNKRDHLFTPHGGMNALTEGRISPAKKAACVEWAKALDAAITGRADLSAFIQRAPKLALFQNKGAK